MLFAAYLATVLSMWIAGLTVYVLVTPHPEIALVRAGNRAAALALAGAMLGFALPLASLAAHAVSIPDLAAWALVALAVQLAAHLALRVALRPLAEQIARDNAAVGLVSAAVAIAVGTLNAACLTY